MSKTILKNTIKKMINKLTKKMMKDCVCPICHEDYALGMCSCIKDDEYWKQYNKLVDEYETPPQKH